MKEKSGRFLVGFDSSRKSRSLFVAWLLVAVFFFVCVLFPLFSALTYVRLGDFKAVFFQGLWRRTMLNTLLECVFSTALSVLVGYVFAYAVVKGDIPARRFFAAIPILHLITPPFVGGLAFILLFGKQGFITHKVLGLNISLYGFSGLLIAQTLCFFPMAYLICAQTLKGIKRNGRKRAEDFFYDNAAVEPSGNYFFRIVCCGKRFKRFWKSADCGRTFSCPCGGNLQSAYGLAENRSQRGSWNRTCCSEPCAVFFSERNEQKNRKKKRDDWRKGRCVPGF